MKEIYSFYTEKQVEKDVLYTKKGKKGELIEATKKQIDKIKTRVVFVKPSMSVIEEAEFFYGQKFNEYINAGFLTKAMLSKKMGDIGGLSSKLSLDTLQKAIMENIKASRTIEFYGGSKDLSENQKNTLSEAEEIFAMTKTQVVEYEQIIRSQFSQTADAKAEQKLIEWLVFNQSFYEEEIGDKKQLFPIFEGDSFEDKRGVYLALCESIEDIDDPSVLKIKTLFDSAFTTLVRVASIWYNKIAEKQDDIEKTLKEMFADELQEAPDAVETDPEAKVDEGSGEATQEG